MFSSMLSLLGSLKSATTSFISNSLRFRSSASASLSRTPTSNSTSDTTRTFSAWVKRGAMPAGRVSLFYQGVAAGSGQMFNIEFNNDALRVSYDGGLTYSASTNAVFRDPSAWYHIFIASNTTVADPNKTLIYVNGVLQTISGTPPPLNYTAVTGTTSIHRIAYASAYFDGYLTEVNFIDGQALTPASFGAIDSSTGVWAPRPYAGTYGTNGFRLRFNDTSSVAALGTDSSGNGNNWTPTNVSLTTGATYDSMLDVPVNYADGGNGRGNYAVLNPLDAQPALSITNGNLATTYAAAAYTASGRGSISVSSGKWYWETVLSTLGNGAVGITGIDYTLAQATTNAAYNSATTYAFYNGATTPFKLNSGTQTSYGSTVTAGDVVGIALDLDGGSITFYKNGTTMGSAFTGISGTFAPLDMAYSGAVHATNFGQRPFAYTPPAGFRALNTNNLPTPAIVNGANYMAATTYTGNAAARSLSNAVNSVSFQPDLVWIKSRTPGVTSHALFDSTRGVTKYLSSDTTAAETTNANTLTAFGADGFSLGTDTTLVNANANSYIAWQWKESVIAGLDVVSYTGTGANATIAHNLGVAPAMVIVKRSQTGAASNWQVRHTSIAAANSIQLNSTAAAAAAATVWNSAAPTSSVFSIGASADVNASGVAYVAYCFAEIAGFSKFGSYTGNGSADGPFVFCGFRPRWVMRKRTDSATDGSWIIYDTSRIAYNANNLVLFGEAPTIETTGAPIDILSNGFKLKDSAAGNTSGATYIFIAFAEAPSKYALAR